MPARSERLRLPPPSVGSVNAGAGSPTVTAMVGSRRAARTRGAAAAAAAGATKADAVDRSGAAGRAATAGRATNAMERRGRVEGGKSKQKQRARGGNDVGGRVGGCGGKRRPGARSHLRMVEVGDPHAPVKSDQTAL